MFGINWMELLVLLGAAAFGVALLAYLYLRLVKWPSLQENSLEHVRKHALWTGFIAWAVSSLAGVNRAGIYDPSAFYDPQNQWVFIPWGLIIAPVVAALAVHAIGQSTWPAPKSAKRVAALEFRRIRDFVEPALGWTVLGIFILTAGALAYLFFAPGFAPSLPFDSSTGSASVGTSGRVPGYVLATALTLALVILTLGTLALMQLIASRRSLESLTAEQNSTLRTIGMNRLLRVSATMASGLLYIAGNFLAQPVPGSNTTSWFNWLGLINGLVLIAMLLWKPPFLDTATNDQAYNILYGKRPSAGLANDDGPAAAKLTESTTAAVLPAAIIGILVGYLLHTWLGWLGPVVLAMVFILLTYAGAEVLLRRNYATPGTQRNRLQTALPWPMYAALIIAAGLLVTAVNLALRAATIGLGTSEGWNGQGGPTSFVLIPLSCALAILAAGAFSAYLAIRRPGLSKATQHLDDALRRRSLFRIARTVASGWFAIIAALLITLPHTIDSNPLAVQFDYVIFGALCIVMAALLLVYPVRSFTPDDFLAPHNAVQPGPSNVNK